MADTYSRIELPGTPERPDDGRRVVRLEAPVPAYTCSLCGLSWQYREVRNTGRCPTCGSGLLRNADRT